MCSACIRWSVNGLRCLKSRLVLMRAVSHIWNTFSALMKLYFTTINQFECNTVPAPYFKNKLLPWQITLFMVELACGFTYLLYPLQSPTTTFRTLFRESCWTYLNVAAGTREHNCVSILNCMRSEPYALRNGGWHGVNSKNGCWQPVPIWTQNDNVI